MGYGLCVHRPEETRVGVLQIRPACAAKVNEAGPVKIVLFGPPTLEVVHYDRRKRRALHRLVQQARSLQRLHALRIFRYDAPHRLDAFAQQVPCQHRPACHRRINGTRGTSASATASTI